MAQKRDRKKTSYTVPVAELESLIEEATVDAYGESEQATGFLTMIEENIELPFETEVLGTPVSVIQFDIDDRDQVVAVCQRGSKKQTIHLAQLPLPSPPPPGAKWIEAYRHWRKQGWGSDDSEFE
jgi:hypothetical protein